MSRSPIADFPIASEADLARASSDSAFRQQLAVSSLQNLIDLMNALRRHPDANHPDLAAQLKEGAELAVQLSDVVKKLAAQIPDGARVPTNAKDTRAA